MKVHTRPPNHNKLTILNPVPQLVPSQVCLSCEVCCRFPERDSFLRPYFTAEEIAHATAHGIDPALFPDFNGGQVTVVPHPTGEGYLCPAFDPVTSHCKIYEVRPLDCRIYPLALMWSADKREVLLAWDTKCPFMRDKADSGAIKDGEEIEAYGNRMAGIIEQEDTLKTLTRNPGLIGRFQDDVVVLKSLPRLTDRLRIRTPLPVPLAPHASRLTLYPLTFVDRSRFEQAILQSGLVDDKPLAAYAFAYHMTWNTVLSYSWTELAGRYGLFAESPDGLFMPLPPVGEGPLAPALAQAFQLMKARSRQSSVTRVENIPAILTPQLEAMGYRLALKDADYLYRTVDLVTLAGDRYKSQRAACNRFEREQRYEIAPYAVEDRDVCASLYREWASQKAAQEADPIARQMLQDSERAHQVALSHHEALGLTGVVLRLGGAIRAYAFGYRLSPAVFCVFLEVADRTIPGLPQFLFREWCRRAAANGYERINTMDDSGLQSLARSKRSYHPIALIPSFIATEM